MENIEKVEMLEDEFLFGRRAAAAAARWRLGRHRLFGLLVGARLRKESLKGFDLVKISCWSTVKN